MDRNDILPDLDSNEFNINAYQLQALDEANNEEEEQPDASKEKKSLIKTIFFCSSSKTKKERKVSEDVE